MNKAAATILALSCFIAPVLAQERDVVRYAGDFTLLTAAGDSLQLSSLRGTVVLLNLWATWCKPCLEEMPDLDELHQELEPQGFTVIGLAVDGERKAAIDRFVERLEVTYPIVYGSTEVAQAVLGGNAMPILPTTLVLDQKGRITDRIVGTVPIRQTKRNIQALLRQ